MLGDDLVGIATGFDRPEFVVRTDARILNDAFVVVARSAVYVKTLAVMPGDNLVITSELVETFPKCLKIVAFSFLKAAILKNF